MSKLTYVSVAGVLGVSGFAIHHLYSKESTQEIQTKAETTIEVKNIRTKLTSQGFTTLTDASENSHHWTEIKTAYDKIKSQPNKSLKTTSTEVTVKDLQELCKDGLDKERDDLYEKLRSWCVVPTTISSHLKNLKLTPLSTEGESDKGDWEALYTKYISQGSQVGVPELSSTDITDWSKLQQKCKDISSKKNYEDGFDFYLHFSIGWCVKKNDQS
ncbi:hypothetical protein MHC_03685 [Mycoplasma haemocanis str. Illinois]|uniref:Uncharacterized protein n=1 Tax=Mycoplasma haemocanis (strain Illinois) TaxID=1111676 RepID=H6N7H5_MYCHN|nr:hypothetical protein [Mycoplasma haemocanis]AEW45597.1 hypothetical protein MHC_03685 [Mycoplasma haemocanis str. Illinois]